MADSTHPAPQSHPRQGISLDELSQAYAQAMAVQSPQKPPSQVRDPATPAGREPAAPHGEATEHAVGAGGVAEPWLEGEWGEGDPSDGGTVVVSPLTVLESMLFVGSSDNRPLDPSKAADLMRGVTPADVASLIEELNARYDANGCPYKVVLEGAGYRMTLRKAFHRMRNKFYGRLREARLSQAAIDILAIVAYRQPLTAEQVSQLRGTPSGPLLSQLVRRQLLEVDRAQGERKVLFRTSARFLDLFGLESLEELPDSE